MPSFPMPAADELAPDRDQQQVDANGPDLSELDVDPSDLIEGNGQPIVKDAAPPLTPESTAGGGPDLSMLLDEETPKTKKQEDDIRTAKDFDELLGNGESGVGEGDDAAAQQKDEQSADSIPADEQADTSTAVRNTPPEVSQTEGYMNVICGTASTPPTPEVAAGITFDHDLLCRIYNAELACRRAEAEVESCKEQLKEAKAELEGKVERLRELASEAAAADHDAKRPLFNPPKLAETSSETADSPTPTPESEADPDDRYETTDADADDSELDHTPETSGAVQRPLVIRVTLSQNILDDSPGALTSGKEYDVIDIDQDGDVIINDDTGEESQLTADEFEVVTWSGPIEVDADGKPIVTRREDWPEGKAPAKVVVRAECEGSQFKVGKTYDILSIGDDSELAAIDEKDKESWLFDGEYQVVEWVGWDGIESLTTTDEEDDWESLDVNNLDLPDAIINKLYDEKNGINTIGELCAVKSDGADFSVISGIGEKKAEQIEDAMEKFWAKRKGEVNK